MTKKAKRYYWLKLKEDFFDDDTIEWIEEQENGKEYCLFYLKMCLKSIKTEGVLIRKVGNILVPYDAKHLAKITNTDLDTVTVAMNLFKKIGLIQVLEGGEIFIPGMEEMIGSETDKAKLMREKRSKDKLLLEEGNNVTQNSNNVTPSGNNVTETLPNCYTELEKEKDIDKDIDKDKEREKEKEISNLQAYANCYEANIGTINQFTSEWIIEMSKTIDYELFRRGIEICTERGKLSQGYLKGVIKIWLDNNIHTYEQLKAYELTTKINQQNKTKETTKSSGYNLNFALEDEEVTEEELRELEEARRKLRGGV